jgi:hypothetical protein
VVMVAVTIVACRASTSAHGALCFHLYRWWETWDEAEAVGGKVRSSSDCTQHWEAGYPQGTILCVDWNASCNACKGPERFYSEALKSQ